ncbi:SirB2 family protein [Pantoea ananatis]|uniref:SirB2 family protein n=1 Tax=Pantoea ananas TaxID=553 RepID=UPI00030E6FD1|nr:SirB2 family protein [Pantoea ananatis]ASN15513.1 siroheme synthase [Pantoea ananatis]MDQ1225591.1 putative membrane protein SirB2 [Pantoea ananatis]MDR6088889.1 putative membrane protein SirB2 [Pantoea ananatis]PQK91430.1 siroheme synthase [Pantoea ananatis]PWV68633.1 putative membrane protein SirB2 [Pantoea ananatis]
MFAYYPLIKNLHLLTVAVTILLFLLRFYWQRTGSAMLQRRWVRILPHVNDTLLLLSGASLVMITHFYPFSPQGSWLTEKLLGVIIYIALGSVALSRRPRSDRIRWIAFIVALIALVTIIKLALSKMPLLGIV